MADTSSIPILWFPNVTHKNQPLIQYNMLSKWICYILYEFYNYYAATCALIPLGTTGGSSCEDSNVATIVGGIMGGTIVMLMIIIIVLICCLISHKKKGSTFVCT